MSQKMMATTIENLFESNWGIFNAKFQIQISNEKFDFQIPKVPQPAGCTPLIANFGRCLDFGEELFQKNRRKFKKKRVFRSEVGFC